MNIWQILVILQFVAAFGAGCFMHGKQRAPLHVGYYAVGLVAQQFFLFMGGFYL